MTPADLLTDAFSRVLGVVESVLDGADDALLLQRPGPDANPIAWLVWHLTRVQDDHVADVAGTGQIWTDEGYAERFALPLDPGDIGYGHTAEQVGLVRAPAGLLLDYYRATHARTLAFVGAVDPDELDRVVDTRWDPPVTLGVRLVSVVDDCAQHAGQAAYVRGLLTSRRGPSPLLASIDELESGRGGEQ
ncbi:mycothiol transferase [Nocardioides sp. BYT-33-1]|uniref:mycothiol transferase n=1 Tax=Nocardioides sp. BYT-33-1 TaxID=3416952 RepID=UPI003F52BB66